MGLMLLTPIFCVFNIFNALYYCFEKGCYKLLSMKIRLNNICTKLNAAKKNFCNQKSANTEWNKLHRKQKMAKWISGTKYNHQDTRQLIEDDGSRGEVNKIYIFVVMTFSFVYVLGIFGYITYIIIKSS